MNVYRISKKQYANLEGIGGLFSYGRWHLEGKRVIYASEHRSLSALEYLIHLSSQYLLLNNYVLMTIHIPDTIPILKLPNRILVKGWDGINYSRVTQKYGTEFITENKHLILKVPSAIIKQEYNFIINPTNENIKSCTIVKEEVFKFDKRFTMR